MFDKLDVINVSFLIFLCFLFILERKRETDRQTEHEQGRSRVREGHRIGSRLQALSSQHRARCWAWTHQPWGHDLSWSWTLNRLSHPGAPKCIFDLWDFLFLFKKNFIFIFIKILLLLKILNSFNIWETERQSASKGGAEREGDTESEQASGPELSAQSPTRGSSPQSVGSWPGPKLDA